MRLLLVMPNANILRLSIGSINISLREAPLTMTMLAALVPPELEADIRIADESVDSVPLNERFDLVAISCMTGTAVRGYEIADHFRRQNTTVVLGGVHVSLRPDEAAQHADSIAIGFAEQTWPALLRDFAAGCLQRVYRSGEVNLTGLPVPRRDLQKKFGYTMPQTVFATRGCHRRCNFCTVPAVPFGWHTRPVGDVIDEIRKLPRRRFVFSDVNLVSDRDYALELASALVPLGKKWGGLAPLSLADDDELLDLMCRSGCQYLLLGFESIKQSTLTELGKIYNRAEHYHKAMRAFHSRRVAIQGCFIFGMDDDDKNVFADTVAAVNELRIDIPRYAIYTPYPGTATFHTLKSQNRILHELWQYYDTKHVVFQPARMSPEELYRGYRWAYRETFSRTSLLKRSWQSPHPVVTLLGNIAYRVHVNRLERGAQGMTGLSSAHNPGFWPPEAQALTPARSCLHAGESGA